MSSMSPYSLSSIATSNYPQNLVAQNSNIFWSPGSTCCLPHLDGSHPGSFRKLQSPEGSIGLDPSTCSLTKLAVDAVCCLESQLGLSIRALCMWLGLLTAWQLASQRGLPRANPPEVMAKEASRLFMTWQWKSSFHFHDVVSVVQVR